MVKINAPSVYTRYYICIKCIFERARACVCNEHADSFGGVYDL